jgi:hypothetical protein
LHAAFFGCFSFLAGFAARRAIRWGAAEEAGGSAGATTTAYFS